MSDKELLYQILERYIDNLLARTGSLSYVISGPIKNYIFNFIDPYVNCFFQGDIMNSDAAAAYVKKEVNEKIDNFLKEFNSAKGE